MASTDVSSSVLSIIASFANGLEVFKKFRGQRKRKKHVDVAEKSTSDESLLSRSLKHGSESIGREYRRGFQHVGEHFAIGDVTAQTRLAEILLNLNTGLVNIITTFLKRKKHEKPQLDYRSLTEISERCRSDTLGVLRQLYQRIMSSRPPTAVQDHNLGTRCDRRVAKMPPHPPHRASSKKPKIQGPTVARVTIQDSSKPSTLAVVKPGGKKKSASASTSDLSKVRSQASKAFLSHTSSPPPEYEHHRPNTHRSHSSPDPPAKPIKTASSTLTNAPPVPPRPSMFRVQSTPAPPPAYTAFIEPAVEKHPDDVPEELISRRRRKETPTFYSIASASTKLGEIPSHKWAVPYDFEAMSLLNREAQQSGWPVADLGSEVIGRPKRRFGLFDRLRKKSSTLD